MPNLFTCGRLHADDMDVIADALADHIIESTVISSVTLACEKAVTDSILKRRRPRRRPDFEGYYRFLAPYEARIKRTLGNVWDEQRKTVISNMKRTPKSGIFATISKGTDSRIKGLTFNELFEQWAFPKGPANKQLQVVYKSLAEKLMVASAVRETQLHSLSISWDVFNPNIEKWLKTYSIDLADEINTETLTRLKNSLFEGWEAGESIPDLTHRVRDLYEEFDRVRAEMIARSETIRASNRGSQETYRASGVVDRTMWVATPTERTCEICLELDSKVAELGEPFPFEDSYGDGSGPPAHPNSYSKDTDIYTRAGWAPVADIKIGDECLSLDPDSLDLAYLPVIRLFEHTEPEMVHIHSNDLNLMVTPDHDVFYLSDWKHRNGRRGFTFRKAKDLIGARCGAIYRSSEWGGKPQPEMFGLSFSEFCVFMGYYLSEGSPQNKTSLIIAQKNGPKKDKMREDLLPMNIDTVDYANGFRISGNEPLGLYGRTFGKSFEKYIPDEIKNSQPNDIRLFLDAFRLGDGSTRKSAKFKGGNFTDERTYFTSSRRMADDLGELILKVGNRPSFHLQKNKGKAVIHHNGTYVGNYDIWVIRECVNQFAMFPRVKAEIVPYGDVAHCVELPKNHTLWVRRNGKTAWCGNCRCAVVPILTDEIINADGTIGD